jgi:leucyl aminopeptidase (aminopeptidase T)
MSKLRKAAKVALTDLVMLEEDEEVLIVTNPDNSVYPVALALFDEANALKAKPVIVVQNAKTVLDHMERIVVESIGVMPDVLLSISVDEFGEDAYGYRIGYVARDGQKYEDIYNKVTAGDRFVRGFQCPGVTADMFERLVPVDYSRMRKTAIKLQKAIDGHSEIRVAAPSGTDVRFSIKGRDSTRNNGDALSKGSFGNIPAGEVFISPAVGSANGVIAFDGTTMLIRDSIIPERPIEVTFKDGFVTDVAGGRDAEMLLQTIRKGEEMAREIGREDYERNARHLGEFGIGINEHARITGHILEDEKALKTVHFAIGANYDFDANAIIHQDCLVMDPTVWVDGRMILENGDIII